MLNKKKNNKGFTLVELLVVIAIIGVLAVVAVPSLFKNIEKGKIAELEAEISAIKSASLAYYGDNASYPTLPNIEGDIEGLSKPLAGTYTLGNASSPQVQPPNNLVLSIDGSKISDTGFEKLKKDLNGSETDSTKQIVSGSKAAIKIVIIKGN